MNVFITIGIIFAIVVLIDVLSGRDNELRFWNPFRGAPNVKSIDDANRVTAKRVKKLRSRGWNAFTVSFGLLRVPLEELNKPTILFGVPGSGKTSLINIMLSSLWSLFSDRRGRTRFVFLDVKNELPARLHAVVPAHVPIYYLNPLDARASVLDFPKVFADRSDIDQLAHALCPPVQGDQTPFFRDSARQAIALTATVLQQHQAHATRPWGLYDLCSTLADKQQLRRVLYHSYEGKTFYKATLGPRNKSAGDVFSTIRSVIQPLIPAALIELDKPTRLNLAQFVRDDGVAVLGIPPKGSQTVLPLYNVFIRRLIEEAQTVSHPDERLFLVLDEIAMLDPAVVETIIKATCLGRSHGIHVIAATQSLELLEERLGEKQAHAFLASCTTTVGFRAASKQTADYVVSRSGSQEGIVLLNSLTRGKNRSLTTTQHLQVRPTVMADELLHAPLADPLTDSMTFTVVCPTFETAIVTCPFLDDSTVQTDPTFPNTLPRPTGQHALRPFSRSDWFALGFPRRDDQTFS